MSEEGETKKPAGPSDKDVSYNKVQITMSFRNKIILYH